MPASRMNSDPAVRSISPLKIGGVSGSLVESHGWVIEQVADCVTFMSHADETPYRMVRLHNQTLEN